MSRRWHRTCSKRCFAETLPSASEADPRTARRSGSTRSSWASTGRPCSSAGSRRLSSRPCRRVRTSSTSTGSSWSCPWSTPSCTMARAATAVRRPTSRASPTRQSRPSRERSHDSVDAAPRRRRRTLAAGGRLARPVARPCSPRPAAREPRSQRRSPRRAAADNDLDGRRNAGVAATAPGRGPKAQISNVRAFPLAAPLAL
mmetsp:Transcript_111837/g.219211  ORF Transcript_111837/g.219211 Transcript_111837/m.219211 type:complete len:201 (-) Transcript_111837:8-610(-)